MRHLMLTALALASTTAFAGPDGVIFPAWPNVAAGPAGVSGAMFTVSHAVPVNSAELTPDAPIADGDFQWLHLPLTVPTSDSAGRIAGVSVCFRTTSRTGSAFISQTRLTQQLTPGPALVVLDDGTDRSSPTGACYTVTPAAPLTPGGVMQLSLKVVMGDLSDSIEISGGFLRMAPR